VWAPGSTRGILNILPNAVSAPRARSADLSPQWIETDIPVLTRLDEGPRSAGHGWLFAADSGRQRVRVPAAGVAIEDPGRCCCHRSVQAGPVGLASARSFAPPKNRVSCRLQTIRGAPDHGAFMILTWNSHLRSPARRCYKKIITGTTHQVR
jgi:hypothetical protein